MSMIDVDRLLDILYYNKKIHMDKTSDTDQIAVDIDAVIRFIEDEVMKSKEKE